MSDSGPTVRQSDNPTDVRQASDRRPTVPTLVRQFRQFRQPGLKKKACIELEEEISQYFSVEGDAEHEMALMDQLQNIWMLCAARCKVDRYEGKPYRRVTVPRHLRQRYLALM